MTLTKTRLLTDGGVLPFVHGLTLASSQMKLHCLRCTLTDNFCRASSSLPPSKVSLIYQLKLSNLSVRGFRKAQMSLNLRLNGYAGEDGTAVNNKQLFPNLWVLN